MKWWINSIIFLLLIFCSPLFAQNTTAYSSTAQFPGGLDSLKKFIAKKIHPPESIPELPFSKKGKVKFIVLKDGTTGSFEIIQKTNYQYDQEIIRVIKHTKWQPATEKGNPIEEIYTFHYTVIIDDTEE
jgi:Gram-negative bacterial TonB protein C-terminal